MAKMNITKCLLCQHAAPVAGEHACAACVYRMAHAETIKADLTAPTLVRKVQANLVEFGYADLLVEDVASECELIATGQPTQTIIGRLARSMFVDNGLLVDREK